MYRHRTARAVLAEVLACEREAMQEWMGEHRGRRSEEEAQIFSVLEVETRIQRKPRGNVLITVFVWSRDQTPDESYLFSLQIAGKRIHRVEPMSLPRR